MENPRWPHLTSESRSRSLLANPVQAIDMMHKHIKYLSPKINGS